jgi:hypothetical protein
MRSTEKQLMEDGSPEPFTINLERRKMVVFNKSQKENGEINRDAEDVES